MARLDNDTIEKLSHLCRIDCSQQEREALLNDLQKILSYIEQLSEVETHEVVPCDHVLDMQNVFREDKVENILDREVFLSNAPSHIGGMIRVPPVIKSKGAKSTHA